VESHRILNLCADKPRKAQVVRTRSTRSAALHEQDACGLAADGVPATLALALPETGSFLH